MWTRQGTHNTKAPEGMPGRPASATVGGLGGEMAHGTRQRPVAIFPPKGTQIDCGRRRAFRPDVFPMASRRAIRGFPDLCLGWHRGGDGTVEFGRQSVRSFHPRRDASPNITSRRDVSGKTCFRPQSIRRLRTPAGPASPTSRVAAPLRSAGHRRSWLPASLVTVGSVAGFRAAGSVARGPCSTVRPDFSGRWTPQNPPGGTGFSPFFGMSAAMCGRGQPHFFWGSTPCVRNLPSRRSPLLTANFWTTPDGFMPRAGINRCTCPASIGRASANASLIACRRAMILRLNSTARTRTPAPSTPAMVARVPSGCRAWRNGVPHDPRTIHGGPLRGPPGRWICWPCAGRAAGSVVCGRARSAGRRAVVS